MNEAPALPRKLMLLVAAVQGLALLLLYKSIDFDTWPSESPLWSYPLWTLAFAVPVLLLLSFERGNEFRVAKFVGLFAIVLAVVALYIGSQARPYDEFPLDNLTWIFACTMALACFKALMYLQQRAAHVPMTYEVLFTNSWRNFLTLGLALVFTLVFWLILKLWGSLFEVVGIGFFDRLFAMDWFLFPALALAHGLGVIIFHNLRRVIDSITRLLQGLIKLLFPLVLLIALAFVLSLPFVGLDDLWATGYGTGMLLWLLALILFFVNAVYQDGRGERPYPLAIHRALYACLIVAPVISGLSFYGLALRIGQHGLTVGRCWAFVVWLILTLFAVGYVFGVLRRRDQWTLELARVNTGMGLVVLAILLLANSPVLDFRKLSIASQLARVEAGEIELREFDFLYARSHLARPGYLALEELKAQVGDDDPEVAALIEDPTEAMYRQPADVWWERVIYRPAALEVPEGLQKQLTRDHQLAATIIPVLIRADLDESGEYEYVFAQLYGRGDGSESYFYSVAQVYFRQGGGWASMAAMIADLRTEFTLDGVTDGEISLEQSRYKDLHIGDVVLRMGPLRRRPAEEADPLSGIDGSQ